MSWNDHIAHLTLPPSLPPSTLPLSTYLQLLRRPGQAGIGPVGDLGLEADGGISTARVVFGREGASVVPGQADHDRHAGLGAEELDEEAAGLDFGFGRHGGVGGGLWVGGCRMNIVRAVGDHHDRRQLLLHTCTHPARSFMACFSNIANYTRTRILGCPLPRKPDCGQARTHEARRSSGCPTTQEALIHSRLPICLCTTAAVAAAAALPQGMQDMFLGWWS